MLEIKFERRGNKGYVICVGEDWEFFGMGEISREKAEELCRELEKISGKLRELRILLGEKSE